ncbi:Competence protein CoiA-like family protein [Marinilactibacillus piezotolerans]|uniref:Competence protein CoiA-like family protein n=2 Tax=Marinilactibacillus TaxID=191769 RepID=A0A1I3ZKC7_9LACT|nr:Competence protein CoiA-like family protein [Marinilactibacillus piezotolerans]
MIERTNNYQSSGYEVFWILGNNLKPGPSVTNLQKSFIRVHPVLSFYIMHYSTKNRSLQILSHIKRSYGKKWHYNSLTVELSYLIDLVEGSTMEKPIPATDKLFFDLKEIHFNLMRAAHYSDPKIRQFCQELYLDNETLLNMPVELYIPVEHEWLIETLTFQWKYYLLKWIESHRIGQVITIKKLNRFIEQLTIEEKIRCYRMPLIIENNSKMIFYEYMEVLAQHHIIKLIRKNKWSVRKRAERFKSEAVKLETLRKSSSIKSSNNEQSKYIVYSNEF